MSSFKNICLKVAGPLNAWIRVQYRFISRFLLFSELFGTRAYALVQITQKIKKLEK